MIEIKTARYITTDDVEKLTGKHWGDFEFAQMAENDAYQTLCCADWYLEELYEEYEDTKHELGWCDLEDKFARRNCYPLRIKNDIELVEILRKQYGCRDTVLVYVCW